MKRTVSKGRISRCGALPSGKLGSSVAGRWAIWRRQPATTVCLRIRRHQRKPEDYQTAPKKTRGLSDCSKENQRTIRLLQRKPEDYQTAPKKTRGLSGCSKENQRTIRLLQRKPKNDFWEGTITRPKLFILHRKARHQVLLC